MIRLMVFLTIIASLMMPVSLSAQLSDTSYQEIVTQFFAKVNAGEYNEAISYIYSSNRWMNPQSDEIAKVRNGFANLPSLVGKFINYERLTTASITNDFVHLDYVVDFERQPFRFSFEFYRVNRKWITYYFGFRDDLGDWGSEKAKDNFLNSRSQK